jgi:hypothetical protein
MNVTRNQWFAIIILLLTVLTGGSAQLTDLVGPYMTKVIISFSTLATGFLAGVQIILGGQGQQVRDVAAMPGVERVSVNATANPTLASVAVDPTQNKVGATTSEVRSTLINTAKGA